VAIYLNSMRCFIWKQI